MGNERVDLNPERTDYDSMTPIELLELFRTNDDCRRLASEAFYMGQLNDFSILTGHIGRFCDAFNALERRFGEGTTKKALIEGEILRNIRKMNRNQNPPPLESER